MDWTIKLGVVSSVISIAGAVWSLFNVRIIRKTKKEIFSKFKVVKYSNINEKAKTTIYQVKKIALKNKIPKGINLFDINNSVNDYYEKIHEISNDIEKENSANLNNYISNLREKIMEVSKLNNNSSDLIEKYTQLYYIILQVDKEIDKFKQNIIEK
ncbi:hypothetical protein [Chryseobacterium hagamense]|uniref:Uncharacterized protein n=1 Tax=Chryseobacterium hagamense TaxID=395935 RepID=A0A511YLE1_9FLAO|nr:hypothetical protein [Chryseobacterium hagamense]GEN76017.1 hypothetical protein CHA01nite_17570 [Chryseobacterium hagamense]